MGFRLLLRSIPLNQRYVWCKSLFSSNCRRFFCSKRDAIKDAASIKETKAMVKQFAADGLSTSNWELIYRSQVAGALKFFSYFAYGYTFYFVTLGLYSWSKSKDTKLVDILRFIEKQKRLDKVLLSSSILLFVFFIELRRRTIFRIYKNIQTPDKYAIILYSWRFSAKNLTFKRQRAEWRDSSSFLVNNFLGNVKVGEKWLLYSADNFFDAREFQLMRKA